jgi:hypothetical protein
MIWPAVRDERARHWSANSTNHFERGVGLSSAWWRHGFASEAEMNPHVFRIIAFA